MLFELACFDFETALKSVNGKADRLELCENKETGGITPSYSLLKKVISIVKIEVFVMIRCRPGNFIYTESEMKTMLESIHKFKNLNVKGFVFGALTGNNEVDESKFVDIIEAANPLPVTFHRAFDLCADQEAAAEKIIKCGFKRILTSGGKENAFEGRVMISNLIKQYGNEIIFIPGGGIRRRNYKSIIEATGAKEIHSSKILF